MFNGLRDEEECDQNATGARGEKRARRARREKQRMDEAEKPNPERPRARARVVVSVYINACSRARKMPAAHMNNHGEHQQARIINWQKEYSQKKIHISTNREGIHVVEEGRTGGRNIHMSTTHTLA